MSESALTNRVGELIGEIKKEVFAYLVGKIKECSPSPEWVIMQYQMTMANIVKVIVDSMLEDAIEMLSMIGFKVDKVNFEVRV